ncbi:sigma-70 family RNA polymerase sigma factor [Rathayibacter sp. KR2-224]|uniref:sigma-70 family RNA polymerase sigma factor n=1 Tax=Rathayibacter sp. KR2-224 TaxID=3400913 RepID=UPI003BFF2A5D
MISDEELAERTRAGDSRAFGELWSRHAKAGLAAARQFHSIADPDDIVAEAYLQIFRAMQRGGGPQEAFRPYLYRTIRNVALGWIPKARTVDIEDVAETLPSDKPDIETAALEKTITVRAFRTLPERWQTILWYTEVEGMDPAEAAPYLGLTANGAAALAYRAREGLKKAWLQAHVNDERVPAECRWTTERMGDYNRGALSPKAQARFEKHLETCTRCSIIVEEIDDVSGRLAAMLFPLVLGGAGAALLAGRLAASTGGSGGMGGGNSPTAQSAGGAAIARASMITRRPLRTALMAAATVLVAAAVTTGAFAAAGVIGGARDGSGSSTASGDRPGSSASPSPQTAPTQPNVPAPSPNVPPSSDAPAPQTTTPPANVPPVTVAATGTGSPVTVPVVTPPSLPPTPPTPPDVTPPAAPVVTTPADAALFANARPALTGTGEPAAAVHVERYDSQGNDLGPVATAQVDATGAWTVTPTAAIPDGTWVLQFVETDAAGNTSTKVARTVTIDTIALPPVINALPANPLEYLPTISGTAEPNAKVTLRNDLGAVVGTAAADGAGAWSIPLPDPLRDGVSLSATQQDPAGNVSAASAPTSPITFQRPTIDAPSDGATIPATAGGTVVTVQISGTPGQQVQILIDGTWTGNTHTLGTIPITRVTPALPSGPHTIAVRYYDPTTLQIGSLASVDITIG